MRTQTEIDQEYSVVAKLYGDRIFKGSKIQEEIKQLHDKMNQLAQESVEAAAKPKPVTIPRPEAPMPPMAAEKLKEQI